MVKVGWIVVLVLIVVAAAGCAFGGSSTTSPSQRIGALCRQRLAHRGGTVDSVAADLSSISDAIRANDQLIRQIRQMTMPAPLRTGLESRFFPIIERINANRRERIRALRTGDYKRAYFLDLAGSHLSDEIDAVARSLRLSGC